jgi:hypothetical protein
MEQPKKKNKQRESVFVRQDTIESLVKGLSPKIKFRVLANLLSDLKPGTRNNLFKKLSNGHSPGLAHRGRTSGLSDVPAAALLREIKRRMLRPKRKKRKIKNPQ